MGIYELNMQGSLFVGVGIKTFTYSIIHEYMGCKIEISDSNLCGSCRGSV